MNESKFNTTKKSLILSRTEKDDMKLAILGARKPSPLWAYMHVFRYGAVIALIIIVSLGSITTAAERAMPGDYLYPIKTDVNERLVEVLSFSPESKVKYATKLVSKRQKEAAKVISQKEMTPSEQEEAIKSLEEQTSKIKEKASLRIDELEVAGEEGKAIALSTEFESALSTYAEALEESTNQNPDSVDAVDDLQAQVNEAKEQVDDKAEKIIEELPESDDVEKEIDVLAQDVGKEQQKLIEKIEEAGEDVSTEAKELLESSLGISSEAQEKIKEGNMKDAASLYTQALEYAHKAQDILGE